MTTRMIEEISDMGKVNKDLWDKSMITTVRSLPRTR